MFRKENLHKLWKNILKEAQIKNILLFREPSSQENLVSQPWPPVSSSIRDFLLYRTAENAHFPMHLVNVNIKNYLQRKCFITDTAGTKGSIGRGFRQGIITVSPLYLPEARS